MALRRQPYSVIGLGKGIDRSKDASLIADTSSPSMMNCRLTKGVVRKEVGFKPFGTGTPLDGPIVYIVDFPTVDGTIHYLFCTTKSIYSLSSSLTFVKRTSSNLTMSRNEWYCSATMLDANETSLFVISNGVDGILKWNGSTQYFSTLGGTTGISCRAMASFASRLVIGGTKESGVFTPWRVRWSVAGNPEDWTGTGSGFIDLAETGDWITSMFLMKDRLFVIKESSIWELEYVGSESVFLPRLIVDGIGTRAPNATAPLGIQAVLLGNDQIYMFDGYSLDPIGVQIGDDFFNTEEMIVNQSVVSCFAGVYIEELREYWLAVAEQSGIPNRVYKFSFDYSAWSKMEQQVSAFGLYTTLPDVTWAEATGTWAAATRLWFEHATPSGSPTTLIGTEDGYVYEDDRITKSNATMIFETKDFVLHHAIRVVGCGVDAKGGSFWLSYSTDGGKSWSTPSSVTPESDKWTECMVPLNVTTQSIRFKVTSTADDLWIRWIEPWFIERSRSATPKYPS